MSSISSIGGSGSDLFQLLQQIGQGNNSTGSISGSTPPPPPSGGTGGPDSPSIAQTQAFDNALKKQGFSDSQISKLQTQIESAVSSTLQSSNGSSGSFLAVQSAVSSTLQSAGVNTTELQSDLQASSDSSATGSTDSTSSTSDSSFPKKLDDLLKSYGIDPAQFRKELFSSASQSSNSSGGATSVDFSQLFAGLATGSTVDVAA